MKKNKITTILIILGILLLGFAYLKYENSSVKTNNTLVLETEFNGENIDVLMEELNNENEFRKIKLLIDKGRENIELGEYDIDGWQNKNTDLKDIFVRNVKGEDYLVVIIKEDSSRPMIDIFGVSYELHFYDSSFREDKDLLVHFDDGYGFDGISEGEEITFQYKEKDSIIQKLQELETEGKL